MSRHRLRLAKLEAQQRDAADVEVIGFFEADAAAGLWVESGGQRTQPMTPEEIEGVRQASAVGGAILILGPLPGRDRKLIYGVRAADI